MKTMILVLLGIASTTPVRAGSLITFDFTGVVTDTFGVLNAGATVSGYLTLDASVPNSYGPGCGCPGLAYYPEAGPATLVFTTDGGFTLQQTLTAIYIADEFYDGIVDYYTFDADVGTFSDSTNFERLELGLSNTSNPFIPNVDIPTSAPDFSAFQFATVDFHNFTGFTETQLIAANLTSLTLVPEPPSLCTFGVGLLSLIGCAFHRTAK
jgi:hypothetical protein